MNSQDADKDVGQPVIESVLDVIHRMWNAHGRQYTGFDCHQLVAEIKKDPLRLLKALAEEGIITKEGGRCSVNGGILDKNALEPCQSKVKGNHIVRYGVAVPQPPHVHRLVCEDCKETVEVLNAGL
jgi:hypothetical protein